MRIRTKVAWVGVPQGTTGTLLKNDEDRYHVTWDIPSLSDAGKPYVDGFTQDEVYHYLEKEK